MATNNWNQIRLLSAKHDSEKMEYFLCKELAEKIEEKLDTLTGAARELHQIDRMISRRMIRIHGYRHNHFVRYTRPMRGLRIVQQAVRRCLLSIARKRGRKRRTLEGCRTAAEQNKLLANETFENLREVAAFYDSERIFKLTTTSDVGTLRNVRDALPNKVLVFSVGYSVSGQILESMIDMIDLLHLEGLERLSTSALFEMRGGRFRMLTEEEARRHGFGFRGAYGGAVV